MSPAVLGRGLTYQRFPRVSGDEPEGRFRSRRVA